MGTVDVSTVGVVTVGVVRFTDCGIEVLEIPATVVVGAIVVVGAEVVVDAEVVGPGFEGTILSGSLSAGGNGSARTEIVLSTLVAGFQIESPA